MLSCIVKSNCSASVDESGQGPDSTAGAPTGERRRLTPEFVRGLLDLAKEMRAADVARTTRAWLRLGVLWDDIHPVRRAVLEETLRGMAEGYAAGDLTDEELRIGRERALCAAYSRVVP